MELGEYDHQEVEAAGRALWEAHDIYAYDRDAHGPVFSVDTPPPYVSAAHLHVGHATSYSQPDFIVRFRRMLGERVFYPIGFDDNGLPTERYVEQAYGVRAADMPRAEFVALCLAETQRTAERYEDLWRRLGLSLDWSLRYSTIDARCQRTAQASFIRLHQAGYLRRAQDPILWCPEDRTSLAQADVEDLERTSRLHTIMFPAPDPSPSSRPELLIATTRPATPGAPVGERNIVDKWVLSHLADALAETTAAFEAHDYMQAHQAASRMFWSVYCDRYIEMIKDRLSATPDYRDRDSARRTLWESYRVLLGLFAPFAPFVTDHMYQQFYRPHEGAVSLHVTRWPVRDPTWRSDRSAVDQLAVILDATRALRSAQRLGNSGRLSQLIAQALTPEAEGLLDQIAEPLRIAARARTLVRAPASHPTGTTTHPSGVEGITVDIVA